jgi:hypothetical protein
MHHRGHREHRGEIREYWKQFSVGSVISVVNFTGYHEVITTEHTESTEWDFEKIGSNAL